MTNYGGKALATLNAVAAAADSVLGLPISAMEVLSKTYLTESADRELASLFGFHYAEDGVTDLYLEAIVSYSNFLGVDSISVLVKVFLAQVYHAMRCRKNKKINFKRAARFADRCLHIINYQFGFELDERPQIYFDESVIPALRADEIWRAKWLANDSVTK